MLWDVSLYVVPINVLLNGVLLLLPILQEAQVLGVASPNGSRRQPQPSSNRLDSTLILELFRGLNVPDDVLDMVSNKLNPAPPDPKPEKLLLDLRNKIDAIKRESARLEGGVKTKNEELNAASERGSHKAYEPYLAQEEYNELKERIDRPVEENQRACTTSCSSFGVEPS